MHSRTPPRAITVLLRTTVAAALFRIVSASASLVEAQQEQQYSIRMPPQKPPTVHLLLLPLLLAWLLPALTHGRPCYTAFSRDEFPECVELGPNGTYSLGWKVRVHSAPKP